MCTKEYIKLYWYHDISNEPRIIMYEVDLLNDRLMLRLIDIYADGKCVNNADPYADVIEIVPIDTVEELNMSVWGEEFRAVRISKDEFEDIWNTHSYNGSFE